MGISTFLVDEHPYPFLFQAQVFFMGMCGAVRIRGKHGNRILESNPPTEIPDVGIIPSDPNLTEHWANRAYFQAVKKGSYMYIIGGQDFSLVDKCFFLPPNIPVIPK